MCLVAPFLSGDVVTCFSEGPKVEEMEGVEEPQCDSPHYQERELGSFRPHLSHLSPTDSPVGIWYLSQEGVAWGLRD